MGKEIVVGVVEQTARGALLLKPRAGRRLALGRFAATTRQADGTWLLEPEPEWIGLAEALKEYGLPRGRMRAAIEKGNVRAYERSPGRWVVELEDVRAFHARLNET